MQRLVRASVVAGLSLVATFSVAAQETPGIVRITKPSTAAVVSRQQVQQASFGHFHGGYSNCDSCQNGGAGGCPTGNCQYGTAGGCPTCWPGCPAGCNRSQCTQDMINYFHCKFGYFIPTGAGGAGVPFCGKYARVYPQDPYYFDQRDGQAWGAQGYGMPMAVPLAPTVGHTYNYGWGTPSSRLTPVSRPAY